MTYVFIGAGGNKYASDIIAARKNKKLQCVFYLDSIVQGEAKYKGAYFELYLEKVDSSGIYREQIM